MKTETITTTFAVCKKEELSLIEQELIEKAIAATESSYSIYSKFSVGSAVLLENGHIVIGCNQENAAFGVTICAERTAIFSAGAQFPHVAVKTIAIAARTVNGLLSQPVTPCGSCRQAMIETEQRFGQPMRILLYGTDCTYVIDGIRHLMPLSFTEEQM